MSKKLVPELRFPEFEKDGDWVENTLDEVAIFLKGKGISKADIVENGTLPCIRYGELYTHYNETISTIKSYTNSKADDLILSEANDVIIPASGETHIDIATASCVLEKGIALGGDLNIIRSNINGVFLSYYFNNAKKKEIAQMAQGIAVVHLYPNQLRTLQIQIPKAKEQQKIASCLSSLDEVITSYSQKIEVLREHKKGLMQNLFPQKDETIPKYRFPEFENDGEWIEKKLGNIVDIRSGLSPSTHSLLKSGKIPFLKVEDLNNCVMYQTESREYTNKGKNVVPINSLIFPKRGAAILLNKVRINKKEVLMDSNLMAITPKHNNNEEFLYYSILVMGLDKIADTSTIPQINNKHILPLEILLPSKPEQQRIASCLSALDALISTQAEKIDQLKLHKKGLLQNLFPSTTK